VLDKYTFDNFTTDKEWQKDMLAKARAFRTQNKVHCFFIGGNSGAGKTHLCSALAIDYLRHGSEVKYILWRKELREIRRKIFDEGNEGYLDYLKNVDVLYLDDFFKSVKAVDDPFQRPTQADANLAFEIISERLDRDRITIISTECTLDELIAIDEAMGSRIRRGSEGFATVVRRDRKNNYRMREG
jgi:DNA replication protein DnaC